MKNKYSQTSKNKEKIIELRGKGISLDRRKKRSIIRELNSAGIHLTHINKIYEHKTFGYHGRTYAIKYANRQIRDDPRSFGILPFASGKLVKKINNSLTIRFCRLMNIYKLYMDNIDNIIYIKVKVWVCKKRVDDVLSPFSTLIDDEYSEEFITPDKIHLQPSIAMIPNSNRIGIYGFH